MSNSWTVSNIMINCFTYIHFRTSTSMNSSSHLLINIQLKRRLCQLFFSEKFSTPYDYHSLVSAMSISMSVGRIMKSVTVECRTELEGTSFASLSTPSVSNLGRLRPKLSLIAVSVSPISYWARTHGCYCFSNCGIGVISGWHTILQNQFPVTEFVSPLLIGVFNYLILASTVILIADQFNPKAEPN